MKQFITKSFLFISICALFYTVAFFYLKNNLKNEISKRDTIILGDSHTMFINPPNTFNYSYYGFPYILHFNFINEFKEIIKNKKVIIVFSPNNISNEFQNRFDNIGLRPTWVSMVNKNLNSFNFLPLSSYIEYKWYEPFAGKYNKSNLKRLIRDKYVNSKRVSLDTTLFKKKIIEHYTNPIYIKEDSIQIKYLYKTIKVLKKNNCQIILLNTPKTKFYTANIPENIIKKYNRILKNLSLPYLNLNTILNNELDSSCFFDADHTNSKGDRIVNDYLKNNGALF